MFVNFCVPTASLDGGEAPMMMWGSSLLSAFTRKKAKSKEIDVQDKPKEIDGLDKFFDSYANKLSGLIEPEGVEALCSDLGVEHTDVRILMLAWKMSAKTQGYFTRDEWRTGLQALRVDSINKLKTALPALEKEVMDPVIFEKFYAYAFRYCLTEDKQKCLDIDTICVLLDIVCGPQFPKQVESFTDFLKIQKDYKVMNFDQWSNFLRFCHEISFPDLQNYDADQAWPIILDNFVDWFREKATSA